MTCVKKHIGARNEMIACTWLLEHGYEVFRNVSPFGEVDIIARRGAELVLLDVKGLHTRATGYTSGTKNKLSQNQVDAGVKRLNVFDDGSCELVDEVFAKRAPLHERPCERCAKAFQPLRETARFCSRVCNMADWRAKQVEVVQNVQ